MENTNLRCLSLLNHFFKRFFDISMSFIGLILSGWIIVLAFFLATIDTRKGGIFTQSRIGQYGKPFKVIKIRTMRDIRGVDTNVTTLSDPRITKLGFFFRKTKIDELPQLINVFLGKMSFVGPRPALFNQDDLITLRTEKGVDKLLPGITGWAQVNGRDELSIPDKVALDVEYLNHQSFWFDMKILWMTFLKVVKRDGVSH